MLEIIKNISRKAGKIILDIYGTDDFKIETKDDDSPLTTADKKSNKFIVEELKKEFPDIPVISEEGKDRPYEERKNWERFFLVDPLDGTKEFIKRNGEFTVNIALIENRKPVLGVIHVPVLGDTYYGEVNKGAYKESNMDLSSNGTEIKVSNKNKNDELNVVQSRSHSGQEESDFYSKYNVVNKLSRGSSLKICMVAEGSADIYYRSGPTWEWDTAAGHAILLAAGGFFISKDKSEFLYNKETLLNKGFIASTFKLN